MPGVLFFLILVNLKLEGKGMSKKNIYFNNSFIILAIGVLNLIALNPAMAAKGASYSEGSSGKNYSAFSGMNLDVSAFYLRQTKTEGTSDFATRASLGGMFTQSVGMDLTGMYETKSSNYLVGANLHVLPVQWLFLKGGVGGYSERQTKQFQVVPILGGGIRAAFSDTYQLVSELIYFQTKTAQNIGFGAGVGILF